MKILLLILTTLYLFFDNLAFADRLSEICSDSATCGNQTVSFPFYIPIIQEPLCGYPGFELSCRSDDRPILNLSGDDYIVHKIFYHNQSLLVSNAAFSAPNNGSCIPPIRNLSLPDHHDFSLGSDQRRVFLIYNCLSRNIPRSIAKYTDYIIGCSAENSMNFVLALPEEEGDNVVDASQKCGTETAVAAPVLGYMSEGGKGGMKEALSRGFILNWIVNNCSHCSGAGVSGFGGYATRGRCECLQYPDPPRRMPRDRPGKKVPVALILGLPIVAGIVVLVAILCCLRKKLTPNACIFFCKNQNQSDKKFEAFLRNYGPNQVRRYSYQDVKKMTKFFSEKLGQGGFGDVYKGKLQDGCHVAVKVLNQSKGEDGQEFVNEVATISRTSHVNIVTLLGFCFEGSKRALVYEYMANGSLEKFIFDENENAGESSRHLDWKRYYQISLGIARGLEYLHRGCNTRILHFDIKPHNILLDADFVPKISDFGLAKICAKNESSVSVLGPRGTIGYIAPEVFSRSFGEVSYKSDVYSYGIMVLEMVGGKKNINVKNGNTSEIYFPQWIYKRLEFDEELGLKKIVNEEDRVRVRKMVIVSLWCIQTDPSNRPTMSKVIEMLEGSLDSLQVPPKPFLSSPSSSPTEYFSTYIVSN